MRVTWRTIFRLSALLLLADGCGGGSDESTTGAPVPGGCTPGERLCQQQSLLECDGTGAAWQSLETCAYGCSEGACEPPPCEPDCTARDCGDDGCGHSCGECTGTQDECVDGSCVCQPACSGKDCGDDGCGGVCGSCDTLAFYCDAAQTCQRCESAECGVCDEIDVSQIVAYSGPIGGDHAINQLRAEVLDWPITTDLEVDVGGPSPCFVLRHFDGESWSTTSNGFSDGAAMVACWHSIQAGGIVCQSYEWYSPDWNICRSMDWPADRPVAHVLISAIDDKRTAIKYFASWPYNQVSPDFDSADVGTELVKRECR